MPATGILNKDEDRLVWKETWNYQSLVSILNYLGNIIRPDIIIAVY